jgi:hypothetical protein
MAQRPDNPTESTSALPAGVDSAGPDGRPVDLGDPD